MIASRRVSSGMTERPILGRMKYPPARNGPYQYVALDTLIGIRVGPRMWVESSGTLKSPSARARLQQRLVAGTEPPPMHALKRTRKLVTTEALLPLLHSPAAVRLARAPARRAGL